MLRLHPPATPKSKPSAEYRAEINGQPAFLHAMTGFAGGTVAWLSFDFDPVTDGPVTIKLTALRNVDTVEVRPLNAGVEVALLNNTATFTLTKNGHYFAKVDGTFQLPVYIFANPPESAPLTENDNPLLYAGPGPSPIPRGAARNVHYFGPGEHRPGVIRLKSGQTVYLASGAVVHGVIVAEDASDIRITGRGILRGSHIPFGGTPECRKMIELVRCRRVIVEGITVLDGFGWNIIAHHCDDVRFAWVKVMTERPWSTDGINPCASRDVVIEDCFMRTKDDCVSVKGLDWEHPDPRDWVPLRDITIRRCVLWSDNNNAVVVGSETRSSVIERIRFEDCDILYTSNTVGDEGGVLSVIVLDDTTLRDITFADIRVEYALCPLINVFFTNEIFDIPSRRLAAGGVIRDVVFRNITLFDGPSRRSYLLGMDALRKVTGVRIENLVIRGKRAVTAADARLETNAFAEDITLT